MRELELGRLLEMVERPGSIVEVVAGPGMGKTSLLKLVALQYQKSHGGTVEFFSGSPGFELSQALDALAEAFRSANGQSLLVVDNAEALDANKTFESINRLSTGPWRFSTVLGSRSASGIAPTLNLEPLPVTVFGRWLTEILDRDVPASSIEYLWRSTNGNPLLATILLHRLNADLGASIDTLPRLLSPISVPGLVGPDGRPLAKGSPAERKLITDVRFVSEDLLRHLSENPEDMYQLPHRKFEEVVAELLDRRGYEVTLTQATRDGGKDMYAARRDDLGSFLYIVEAKRYAPDRSVGVGVVRALHGVAQHERVNAAIVMTTSFFSQDAKEYARDLRSLISLKDYFDLREWLTGVQSPRDDAAGR